MVEALIFKLFLSQYSISIHPKNVVFRGRRNGTFQANIYWFKFNNRNTRKRFEICSKLTTKTQERRHDVVLVFLLLTLNIFHTFLECFYCQL